MRHCARGAHKTRPAPRRQPKAAGCRPTALEIAQRPLEIGQRKHVTILFADVRGSTELVRALDPEEALARIDPVVQGAVAAVVRFGGIVNEVQGDGLMALFGAPLAAEDHPVCACLAARAILQGLPPGIEMRVGVHSGEVVIRPSGRDASDYAAIGPAVYFAKRLEQAADPGTARLSAETARLTRGYTDLRPLGQVQAKGWDEPVEMFELLHATDRPSWEVRSAGSLSCFVGREAELAALSSALMRATLGTMQAVTLVADAGVGKSRLAHEFLHGPTARGIRVVRAAAAAHAGNAPFHVAAELLRSWIGAVAGDDRAALARRLDQAIAVNLTQGMTPDAAALHSLLDLSLLELPAPEQAAWTALDPAQRRQRLIDVTRGVLLREAAQRPLIVLVEDLHWVDEASRELLAALVAGAGATRLLLFATTRPGGQPDWAARSNSIVLRLEPLDRAQSEALLQRLVGDAPELAAVARPHQRPGGRHAAVHRGDGSFAQRKRRFGPHARPGPPDRARRGHQHPSLRPGHRRLPPGPAAHHPAPAAADRVGAGQGRPHRRAARAVPNVAVGDGYRPRGAAGGRVPV